MFKTLKDSNDSLKILSMTLANGANVLLPIIIIPLFVSKIGLEGYGLIAFAIGTATYFSLFIEFGYNLSAAKALALETKPLGRSIIVNSVFLARGTIFLIMVTVYLFILSSQRLEAYRMHLIYAIPVLISSVINPYFFYQERGKLAFYAFVQVLGKVLALFMIFISVKSSEDSLIGVIIQSVAVLMPTLFLFVRLFLHGEVAFQKVSFNDVFASFKESFPIFLSNFSMSLYNYFIIFFLGVYTEAKSVGLMNILNKIVGLFYSVVQVAINQYYFPLLVNIAENVKRNYVIRVLCFSLFMGFMYVIVVVVAWQLGKHLLFLRIDESVMESSFLYWMLINVFAMVISSVLGQLLMLTSVGHVERRLYMSIYLFMGSLGVIISYYFVKHYFLSGAIYSYVLIECLVALYMLFAARKFLLPSR